MNLDWKIWAIGGVGLLAVFTLLSKKSSAATNTATQTTTPVGQSYSYLDGSGIQHLIATDPNGNLTSYNSTANFNDPQIGQLSTYVGMMGHNTSAGTQMGYTPYYANFTDPFNLYQDNWQTSAP